MRKITVAVVVLWLSCVMPATAQVWRSRYSFGRTSESTVATGNRYMRELPVLVPADVGVVSIIADDPLENSYGVLYRECRRRGIPITLNTCGIISIYAPINDATSQNTTMTDAHLAEIFTRGGGSFQYHSLSHGVRPDVAEGVAWPDFSLGYLDWWKREISGADYGERIGAVTNTTCSPSTEGKTPGDRIAAQIQTAGFFEADGSGALYVTCQGFGSPGQWGVTGGSVAVPTDSQYFTELRKRWGDCIQLYYGKNPAPLPARSSWGSIYRITNAETLGYHTALIDAAIANGRSIIFMDHDWLDTDEDSTTVEGGSAKATYTCIEPTVTPELTLLQGVLDYIKEKVDGGTLVAMGGMAARVAEVGTPVSLLTNYSTDNDIYDYVANARQEATDDYRKFMNRPQCYLLQNDATMTLLNGHTFEPAELIEGEAITITGGAGTSTLTTTIASRTDATHVELADQWTATAVESFATYEFTDHDTIRPFVFHNRAPAGETADTRVFSGWWTLGEVEANNETYILSFYARLGASSTNVHPVVTVFGSSTEPAAYTASGTTTYLYDYYDKPGVNISSAMTLAGMLEHPLYEYTCDGSDCMDVPWDADMGWTQVRIPLTIPKPIRHIAILFSTSILETPENIAVHFAGPVLMTPNGPGQVQPL